VLGPGSGSLEASAIDTSASEKDSVMLYAYAGVAKWKSITQNA